MVIDVKNGKSVGLFEYSFDFPTLTIHSIISLMNTKGNLAYEYHPFKNFRYLNDYEEQNYLKEPIVKNSLQDFDTEKFNFDLKHPVDITCLPSYDGSVNLILNDGKNTPKLINSRFSVREYNTYEVVDRVGTNDTNIYDYEQFDLDTSLYKRITKIPKIKFLELTHGGKLPVGNYNFYFKFSDADGNETDFIGETGSITCHIGSINDPKSIRGGLLDENSNKLIQLMISDIDTAYDYVNVYYTRLTSAGNQAPITEAKKIKRRFKVKGSVCFITVDGFEDTINIPTSDINQRYFITNNAKTLAVCLNRLFLANLSKPKLDIPKLTDLSLRMLPYYNKTESSNLIGNVDQNYYDLSNKYEYYNVKNIYNYLGYWDEEIYRLGVVYIMNDDSLSPVFNIRGRDDIPNTSTDIESKYETNNDLNKPITYDEVTYEIGEGSHRENAKGVIRIDDKDSNLLFVYSIGIYINNLVKNALQDMGVKGLFFVRLKRIPTILAQAFTIGHDIHSGLPLIYYNKKYYAESFIDKFTKLSDTYKDRLFEIDEKTSNNEFAICPEYELMQPHFDNLFTDSEFVVKSPNLQLNEDLHRDKYFDRHYYNINYSKATDNQFMYPYVIAIGDNVSAKRNELSLYSTSVGDPENIEIFKCVSKDKKIKKASDITKENCIVRGAYGPLIGLSGYKGSANKIVNIYIPDYSLGKLGLYFKIRYDDTSAFFAISDRLTLNELNNIDLFRGDCYICNYTHRINRNFQDPEVPNADRVVDVNTWKDNFNLEEPEKLNKINRGDINAVNLGSWITFKLRSNINLSMRDLDPSYPDEMSLTGVTRTFYPLSEMSIDGNHKLPESSFINLGISSNTSCRFNFTIPEVPYYKNIYQNRIAYSDIAVENSFKNGFRVFSADNFLDYQALYGSIVKLLELDGDLICVLEHGIVRIPVNERVQAGEGTGGPVYVHSTNVLPINPLVISNTLGSHWKDSIIKTPKGIYGVDTVAKKIWKTDGRSVVCISDNVVLKFLNDNISLEEREVSPIIGIRNVKTHYNAFKLDVMFTFYDNRYGFEDKAWNLCYNEITASTHQNTGFLTFYSWLPSYSENIDNIYFSFNRDTSKNIAKLSTSDSNSNDADGVVISKVLINSDIKAGSEIGYLSVKNRSLPKVDNTGVSATITFKLDEDSHNYNDCFILQDASTSNKSDKGTIVYKNSILKIKTLLPKKEGDNINYYADKIKEALKENTLIYLNIKAVITADSSDTNIKGYVNDFNLYFLDNYGFYESRIALTSKETYNNPGLSDIDRAKPNLNTDFWKHGLSGIIDIKDPIKPCFWYGKLHPFEFEFIVNVNPDTHKIFDLLLIISNNAEPESFHYEITGDCFDFANDKYNMYVRLELTKYIYNYNGYDIKYDRNALKMIPVLRDIPKSTLNIKDKSTILPLYYNSIESDNTIYDYYEQVTSDASNYDNLSGTEVIYKKNLNEFRLNNRVKAVNINDGGRLRGNMNYQEDKWRVLINPILIKLKNEEDWGHNIPISLFNSPIPSAILENDDKLRIPDSLNLHIIDTTLWIAPQGRSEIKLKDKYIKIKIRYEGNKLALISEVRTLFRIVS